MLNDPNISFPYFKLIPSTFYPSTSYLLKNYVKGPWAQHDVAFYDKPVVIVKFTVSWIYNLKSKIKGLGLGKHIISRFWHN